MAKGILNLFSIRIALALLVIQLVNMFTGYGLNNWFGIHPRDLTSIHAILTAPFFHFSFSHFTQNFIPFIILSTLASTLFGNKSLLNILVSSGLIGGVAIWVLGASNSLHAGASIFIYGLISWLIVYGILKRSIPSVLVSVFVFIMYGTSFLYGLVPQENMSFLGHFFGGAGGVAGAFFFNKYSSQKD